MFLAFDYRHVWHKLLLSVFVCSARLQRWNFSLLQAEANRARDVIDRRDEMDNLLNLIERLDPNGQHQNLGFLN